MCFKLGQYNIAVKFRHSIRFQLNIFFVLYIIFYNKFILYISIYIFEKNYRNKAYRFKKICNTGTLGYIFYIIFFF